ncbi:UDP-N-acetylmuramate dehydrogenase [Blattabacterium cuenoti]|uniref:UDP-N-acetylmuramate dehydrogenase n=1 Tax=Blattabacterium cuenoti TaxID=1653831 RepID=UPI00163BEC2A|nr:UDP-N-acetylmuramate dehydrogenase [Blattabacterium cuenoti]
MFIKEHFPLIKLNTFGLNVHARYFVEVTNVEDLHKIFSYSSSMPKFIIGNGSNILFLKDYYPGLILKIGIKGKKIVKENNKQVIVQAYAGEKWNNFVNWTIKKGFSGLENLSFIPGTVGASPIQNIGAYGTEIKNVLLKVKTYEVDHGKIIEFSRKKCQLKYRDSFFKSRKNRFIILSVFFLLKKGFKKNNSFFSVEVENELKNMNIKKPTIEDISKAIFNIRHRNLPDTKKIGNAGSFFINPVIKNVDFKIIKHEFPNIIGYKLCENKVKISANSLIESIGWKGRKIGNVGVYEKKPIIIVNYGKATGIEIYSFSEKIIEDVKKVFGIILSREVNIIQ